MRVVILLLVLSFPILGQVPVDGTMQYGGIERTFITYTPACRNNGDLLLLFHGHGGNAHDMLLGYGFVEAADWTGMVVVAVDGAPSKGTAWPDGTRSWNADNCCGASWESGVDDVGFVSALIDEVKSRYHIGRVFLLGFSNGGMLCHRIAREVSGITGIADISGHGGMYVAPMQPLSVVMVHGEKDEVVPFDEGASPNSDGRYDIPYWRMVELYNLAFGFESIRARERPMVNCKVKVFANVDRTAGLLSIVFPEGGHECPAWPFVLDSILRFWMVIK